MSDDASQPTPTPSDQTPAWMEQGPAWKRNWSRFQLDVLRKMTDSLDIPFEEIEIGPPRNAPISPARDD